MNSVQLIGRLVSEPRKGNGVVSITLAVDRPTKEKGTDFPVVKIFGKQGENVVKYLHKGSQCAIDGSIETGSYEKNGEKIYYTDVVAHRVEFVGGNVKRAEKEEEKPVEVQEVNEQESVDTFEELDEDVPF